MKFFPKFSERRCANPECFSADIEAGTLDEALEQAEEIGRAHLEAISDCLLDYGANEAGLDIVIEDEDGREVRASLEPDLADLAEEVKDIVESYEGDWTGCDWDIEDPDGEERIGGMRSEEAHRVAMDLWDEDEERARAWLDFAKHLEEIEEEAEVAWLCARHAIDEVGWGDFLAALRRIEDAEAHEANYGDSPIWSSCRREVEAAIRGLDYTFVRR